MYVTAEDSLLCMAQGQISIEWKIHKFFDFPKHPFYGLSSPFFELSGTQLFLQIFPNDGKMLLSRRHIQSKSGIVYKVGIMKADGTVFKSLEENVLCEKVNCNFSAFPDRLEVLKLKDDLAPDGDLKVFLTACSLDRDAADSMKADTLLSKHEVNACKERIKDLEERLSVSTKKKDAAVDKSKELENKVNAYEEKLKNLEGKLSVSRKEKDAALDRSKTEELVKSVDILSANFKELLLSEYQADFTIKVKDKEFKVHKTVLSARSSAFRAMLEADMAEKRSGEVNIKDCEPSIFEDFLLFLYSGKCSVVSSSNALGMYLLADKYDLPDLKEASSRCLAREVSIASVCDVVQLAALHDESDLLEAATAYFVDHVDEVLKIEKWQTFFVENPTIANELLLKMVNKYKK